MWTGAKKWDKLLSLFFSTAADFFYISPVIFRFFLLTLLMETPPVSSRMLHWMNNGIRRCNVSMNTFCMHVFNIQSMRPSIGSESCRGWLSRLWIVYWTRLGIFLHVANRMTNNDFIWHYCRAFTYCSCKLVVSKSTYMAVEAATIEMQLNFYCSCFFFLSWNNLHERMI